MQNVQRLPAEQQFEREIDALIAAEKDPIPTGWRMSPKSVLTYICGGNVGGVEITPKYVGNRRLVEICIATLVTDRALLLIGEPGTAKSWLSEHLTAAINGDSTKVVQGTAGTTEEQIRYSWNYAMLIAREPSPEAMVKSPVYHAMESGTIAQVEEYFQMCQRGTGRTDLHFIGKAYCRTGTGSGNSCPERIFGDRNGKYKG